MQFTSIKYLGGNMSKGLNDYYRDFQQKKMNWEEFRKELEIFVFHFIRENNNWDEDSYSDFFIHFHSYLEQLVTRYQEKGKSFRAFFTSSLRWRMKSFRSLSEVNKSCWELMDNSSHYLDKLPAKTEADKAYDFSIKSAVELLGRPQSKIAKRRFLILALKAFPENNHQFIKEFSEYIDLPQRVLEHYYERLKANIYPRKKQMRRLTTRLNSYYFRSLCIKHALFSSEEGPYKSYWQRKLHLNEKKMIILRKKLLNLSCQPKNEDIAQLLGIPKGTVDSGLFYMRSKLRRLDQYQRSASTNN